MGVYDGGQWVECLMLEVPMVAGSVVQGAYYCGLIQTEQLVKGHMVEGVYSRAAQSGGAFGGEDT
jgi:hypothetical protein